jgi:hypothetical protein
MNMKIGPGGNRWAQAGVGAGAPPTKITTKAADAVKAGVSEQTDAYKKADGSGRARSKDKTKKAKDASALMKRGVKKAKEALKADIAQKAQDAQKAQSPADKAAKGFGNAVEDFGKKIGECCEKGDFKGVLETFKELGTTLKELGEKLLGDLKAAAGGAGGPGGASGAETGSDGGGDASGGAAGAGGAQGGGKPGAAEAGAAAGAAEAGAATGAAEAGAATGAAEAGGVQEPMEGVQKALGDFMKTVVDALAKGDPQAVSAAVQKLQEDLQKLKTEGNAPAGAGAAEGAAGAGAAEGAAGAGAAEGKEPKKGLEAILDKLIGAIDKLNSLLEQKPAAGTEGEQPSKYDAMMQHLDDWMKRTS